MIIGLGHQAQVGKDTVADILVKGHGFTRLAFADHLKTVALEIDPQVGGRSLSELVHDLGWERAKNHDGVRPFLQRLGVALRTHIDEDVWVRPVLRARPVFEAAVGLGDVVITDVRFPNEAAAIRRDGGRLVKVVRPGFGPANDHESELALADWSWDAVLVNDGTLDDLEVKVVGLLESLAG